MLQYKSGDLVTIMSAEKFDFLSPEAKPIKSSRNNEFTLEMANNLCGKEVEIMKVYPQFYFIKNWPYKIDSEFIDEEETLNKHPEYKVRLSNKINKEPISDITMEIKKSIKLQATHEYGKGTTVVLINESAWRALLDQYDCPKELKDFNAWLLGTNQVIEKKIIKSYYKIKGAPEIKLWDCVIDHEATEKLGNTNEIKKKSKKPNKNKVRIDKKGNVKITTVRKLKSGELVIGWSKENKSDFIIGCFLSHDKDNGVFHIEDNGQEISKSHCQLFTAERAAEFAKAKHKATNPVTKAFNELYVKLGELVGEFSQKYEIEVDFKLELKDGDYT